MNCQLIYGRNFEQAYDHALSYKSKHRQRRTLDGGRRGVRPVLAK